MLKRLPTRPRVNPQGILRIAIVASRYNWELVEPMLVKALHELHLSTPAAKVEVVHAPGSFEIPFLARQVIDRRQPDALICLGVILRGETAHADLIAAAVSDSLCRISVDMLTPVIHAVLLLNNEEQGRVRCLGEEYNRGTEAARAALATITTSRDIAKR